MCVLVKSIFDSLDSNETETRDELSFHILVDDTVKQNDARELLESIANEFKDKIDYQFNFYLVDSSRFNEATPFKTQSRLSDKAQDRNANSFSTYYRLLCASYIPQDVERLLYLDIDIRVLKDIRGVFADYDLSNSLLAGQLDHALPLDDFMTKRSDSERIYIPRETYFNAGVMLINLKMWREIDVESIAFNLIKNYKLECHDQTIINYICKFHKFKDGVTPWIPLNMEDKFI